MTKPNAHVSFQAFNGQFVSAATGALVADAQTCGPHERFEVVPLPNRRVALKASNGCYVGIDYTGGHVLVARATEAGESESFRLEDLGGGNVALHGYCWVVSAEAGGGRQLSARRQNVGQWETFALRTPGAGSVRLRPRGASYSGVSGP